MFEIKKNFGTRSRSPIQYPPIYRGAASGTKNIFLKFRTQNLLEPSGAFRNRGCSLEPRTTSVAPLSRYLPFINILPESKFEVRFVLGPQEVSNQENIVLGSRFKENIFGTRSRRHRIFTRSHLSSVQLITMRSQPVVLRLFWRCT